jgi:hypothetical protein
MEIFDWNSGLFILFFNNFLNSIAIICLLTNKFNYSFLLIINLVDLVIETNELRVFSFLILIKNHYINIFSKDIFLIYTRQYIMLTKWNLKNYDKLWRICIVEGKIII